MRAFLMDKAWYLAWWAAAFIAARLWLVNPLIRSNQESAGRIVKAIRLQEKADGG